MFNTERPSLDQLPTSAQLIRSTVIAGVASVAILVTIVLPAEYGFDPTGAGRVFGLTEMGEIKHHLRRESEGDDDHHDDASSSLWQNLLNTIVPTAHAQDSWRDQVSLTMAPGESAEIKLVMNEGDLAEYSWVAEGGRINFDLHGHGSVDGNSKSTSYKKGRGETSDEGAFSAEFAGTHGWFWRNRDKSDVTVFISLRGGYSELIEK